MVHHLVFFDSLVAGVIGFRVCPPKFIVYFDVFSCVFEDIINIEYHNELLFGISIVKKLIRIQIYSERKKVT